MLEMEAGPVDVACHRAPGAELGSTAPAVEVHVVNSTTLMRVALEVAKRVHGRTTVATVHPKVPEQAAVQVPRWMSRSLVSGRTGGWCLIHC